MILSPSSFDPFDSAAGCISLGVSDTVWDVLLYSLVSLALKCFTLNTITLLKTKTSLCYVLI